MVVRLESQTLHVVDKNSSFKRALSMTARMEDVPAPSAEATHRVHKKIAARAMSKFARSLDEGSARSDQMKELLPILEEIVPLVVEILQEESNTASDL